jgi:hypothetical protein
MPRLIAAYPADHAPKTVPLNSKQLVTVDYDKTYRGWGKFHKGPDPNKTRDAAQFLNDIASRGDVLIPMSEEAVPSVGLVLRDRQDLLGVPWFVCRLTTDKCRCRMELDEIINHQGPVSPRVTLWREGICDESVFGFPVVVKSEASTLSRGVELVYESGDVAQAADTVTRRSQKDLDRVESAWGFGCGVMLEEFISGDQYEINGISLAEPSRVRPWSVLRQHWDRPCGKIELYEPVLDDTIRDRLTAFALQLVSKLGFRWCGWNIEVKIQPDGGVRILDLHCRLGEDPEPYPTLISPEDEVNPTDLLLTALFEEMDSSSYQPTRVLHRQGRGQSL